MHLAQQVACMPSGQHEHVGPPFCAPLTWNSTMLTKSEPPPPEALMLFCVLSLSLTKRLKRSDMVGRHLRAVTRCPLAEVCTRSPQIL